MDIYELIKDFGPFVGFVIIVHFQNWKREAKMSQQADALSEKIISLTEQCNKSIMANTSAMKELRETVKDQTH